MLAQAPSHIRLQSAQPGGHNFLVPLQNQSVGAAIHSRLRFCLNVVKIVLGCQFGLLSQNVNQRTDDLRTIGPLPTDRPNRTFKHVLECHPL